MKKFLSIFIIPILSISLISCSTNKSNNSNNTAKSNITSNVKITYTKEFSYLPTYDNMEFQSITTPTDKNKMLTAKYIIKSTTTDKVLNDYAGILKKDGWTVNMSLYKDGKPFSAAAQKDKHIATLIPQQSGNDVILTVTSI